MRAGFAAQKLLPLACLGGAALLVASQFMTVFELNSAGPTAEALVDSTDQHWYAMAILGVFAALATLGAVGTASKPLAFAVAAAGVAALLLVLLIDLPDAGKTGNISDPNRSFITVEADPQGGFWIGLIGALVLTICGGALATLTAEQLGSLRGGLRRGGGGRGLDGRRPAATWPQREPDQGDVEPAARQGNDRRRRRATTKTPPGPG